MIAFSPIDFYHILYDIVESFPFVTLEGRDVKSRRINTFAVTKNLLEILTSNSLGKDSRYIGKRLFYSTKWSGEDSSVKYEYPALFVGPSNEQYDGKNRNYYYVDYSLIFGDNFDAKMTQTGNQDIDASRTFEQVEETLRDLWGVVYATLQSYVYVELYFGGTIVGSGWFSKGYLEVLKSEGSIDRVKILYHMEPLMSDIEATVHVDGQAPKIITYMVSLRMKHSLCAAYTALPTPTPFVPLVVIDADAQILFNAVEAAGGTVSAEKRIAVSTVFSRMKSEGIYDDFYAFYLPMGGSAATNKFNAKNPIDSNAAFRLLFVGGFTHTENAIVPNGINTYANTYFTPSVHGLPTDTAISYYSLTESAGTYMEMGVTGIGGSSGVGQYNIAPNVSGASFRAVNSTGNAAGLGVVGTVGLFTACRTDALTMQLYKNATLLFNNGSLPITVSDKQMYMCGRNVNNVSFTPTNRACAFGAIWKNATAGNVAKLNTIITDYLTEIGAI